MAGIIQSLLLVTIYIYLPVREDRRSRPDVLNPVGYRRIPQGQDTDRARRGNRGFGGDDVTGLPTLLVDILLAAGIAVVASAIVLAIVEPADPVRSEGDPPAYLAAPLDSVELFGTPAESDRWGIWPVCEAGLVPVAVAGAPNRSVAIERGSYRIQ